MEVGGLPPAVLVGGGVYLVSLQNLEIYFRLLGIGLITAGIWLQASYLKKLR